MGNLAAKMDAASVAVALGCSRWQVYKLAGRGELRGFKIGTNWTFLASDVEDYLAGACNREAGAA